MNRTSRLPRTHIPNTIHHVIIRGNNRQKIFLNRSCFLKFLKIIEESIKKFDHKILSYCLMTNHVHMIIHIHDDSLSNVMKNINFRYARWFNTEYKRIGHLFQGRYRSIAVNNEEYLINLFRYVHFNPVEAKMVLHVDHYSWTSHHHYLSEKESEWMEINLILDLIKNKSKFSYSEFINNRIDREKWKPGLSISENGNLMIDSDIVRDLHPTLNVHEAEYKRKKQPLSKELVADIVCKNLNTHYSKLLTGSHDRKTCQIRIILVHFWLTYTDMSITDISRQLRRTRGTLQRQLDRLLKSKSNYFSSEWINKIQVELDFFFNASL